MTTTDTCNTKTALPRARSEERAPRTTRIILGRDGMGDGASEADFDAYTAYVAERIDGEVGWECTVEQRGWRDVQSNAIIDGEGDEQIVRDALARLWDAFCADDSVWPAAE